MSNTHAEAAGARTARPPRTLRPFYHRDPEPLRHRAITPKALRTLRTPREIFVAPSRHAIASVCRSADGSSAPHPTHNFSRGVREVRGVLDTQRPQRAQNVGRASARREGAGDISRGGRGAKSPISAPIQYGTVYSPRRFAPPPRRGQGRGKLRWSRAGVSALSA